MKLFAPLINDITTDLEDPPSLAEGAVQPPSEKVISAIRKHYPGLDGLRLACDAEEAFRRVLQAAERMEGWKLAVIDREGRRLEGFAVTKLLRFRDDFTVRVRGEADGSIVDMRSRSRAGKGDFGANADRIRSFLEKVERL